jgi:hypothetical protein
MRPIMLSATVAVGILYAAQAQAGGGGPTQLMPSQPWPTYCAFCFGQWQMPPPAEHAPLHLDHLDRRRVIAGVSGAAAGRDQLAFEAAVICLVHGGVHA